MNTLLDEIIPLLEAARSGAIIEECYRDAATPVWTKLEDTANHQWNFSLYRYRVKPPEPREFWLVEDAAVLGSINLVGSLCREWAERYAGPNRKVIHVREVVP